jgi:hypothetical protein
VNGRVVFVLFAVMACKDNSGTAKQVAPASGAPAIKAKSNAPEPPGGPPSCADVAAHLAAALAMPAEIHADVKGTDVAVSGNTMKTGIEEGLADVCRDGAWSLESRKCVLAWQGNVLRERASLRDACPGTVK